MAIIRIDIDTLLELASEHPVIDVRSEAEFTHAHFPGAVSMPLFNNEERKIVGTAYKKESKQKAIKLGLQLFGGKMVNMVEAVERLLEHLNKDAGKAGNKTVIVHCWRGGMRSGGVGWLLDLYGFKVYTLTGGYKAFRRWSIQQLEKDYPLKIIGGYTGSGKTKVLQEIKKLNHVVIDLEDLAKHKGSAFGNIGMPPQPSQEMFENLLAMELFKAVDRENIVDSCQMTVDRENTVDSCQMTVDRENTVDSCQMTVDRENKVDSCQMTVDRENIVDSCQMTVDRENIVDSCEMTVDRENIVDSCEMTVDRKNTVDRGNTVDSCQMTVDREEKFGNSCLLSTNNNPPSTSSASLLSTVNQQLSTSSPSTSSPSTSSPSTCIWLEDESQRIGLVNIPTNFYKVMRNKPVHFINIPFEERLNYITQEYGNCDNDELVKAIMRIQKRLGGLEAKTAINYILEDNFKDGFRILLQYYDKQYEKGLSGRPNLSELLFKVNCETVDAANNARRVINTQTKK